MDRDLRGPGDLRIFERAGVSSPLGDAAPGPEPLAWLHFSATAVGRLTITTSARHVEQHAIVRDLPPALAALRLEMRTS